MKRIASRRSSDEVTIFLIVSDNVVGQAMLNLLKASLKFNVVGQAHTLETSIPLIKKRRPDVVLCASKVPDGHPATLATRLAHETGSRIPILILSRDKDTQL